MQSDREALTKLCADFKVDCRVMAAIITVESNWRPYAVRYEPAFNLRNFAFKEYARENHITEETEKILAKCSWGLGQIMGTTARDMGYCGPLPALCEPYKGMLWAVKYYLRLCERYEETNDRISAYNAGSVSKDINGRYRNQQYVDKVIKAL